MPKCKPPLMGTVRQGTRICRCPECRKVRPEGLSVLVNTFNRHAAAVVRRVRMGLLEDRSLSTTEVVRNVEESGSTETGPSRLGRLQEPDWPMEVDDGQYGL